MRTQRRFDMGRLTFVFNQDKLKAENKTENDLLYPMRVFAQKHGIQETNNGVFELDGNNAFALLGGFVADITDEDHSYIKFLDKWELDVGGIVGCRLVKAFRLHPKTVVPELHVFRILGLCDRIRFLFFLFP